MNITNIINENYISKTLFRRKEDAHKGDFGRVLIYAGSPGMAGAAVLCGRAALKSGAGLVQFLLPDLSSVLLPILQISVPEATCVPLEALAGPLYRAAEEEPTDKNSKATEKAIIGKNNQTVEADRVRDNSRFEDMIRKADFSGYTAIACGSGLGKSEMACRILFRILESYTGTLVLDADALNMIAESEKLEKAVRSSAAAIILTPHIGEARRLLHTEDKISGEESRKEAVCRLAARYQCIAVLKGAGTLVAQASCSNSSQNVSNLLAEEPEFQIFQNTTGNPGMATAGSGDALAGLITSLAAQGYTPLDAARMGVFIHGRAGDKAAEKLGEMGMTSSDIVCYIPYALKN